MPGPYDLVSAVFSNAQQMASGYSGSAQHNINNAVNAGGSVAPSAAPATYGFNPVVVEPNVNIPANAEKAGFEAFRSIWDETIKDLTLRFRDFIVEYFPDETSYINDAQAWLSQAITTGGTGLSPVVEDQIWQRQRARIIRDAVRAEHAQIAVWAGRGFPLPPGAAIATLGAIQRETGEKLADASAQIAIAQAELEQKNTQFAVENAIKLWTGAMDAAGNYIKAIATGPNAAGQIIPSVTDSQAKLISAAADYYRARIAVQELYVKAGQIPAQWTQEANLKNADLAMDFVKAKVQGATEGARTLGTMAAAALNALHASANVAGTSALNFLYSGEAIGPMGPG